jgi:Glycosyl transferases group 1
VPCACASAARLLPAARRRELLPTFGAMGGHTVSGSAPSRSQGYRPANRLVGLTEKGTIVPNALLLCIHNLSAWTAKATKVPLPGGTLPYGLQSLQRDFELAWQDAQLTGIWRTRLANRAGYALKVAAPGLKGSLGACYALPQLVAGADVALSVFENVGLGFARLEGHLQRVRRSIPHVMVTCYLAEDCQKMSSVQLRSVRRSLRSVSRLVVFSSNQAAILHDYFGIEPERVITVPFGVDTSYYDPQNAIGPVGGGGLVAVGGDSARDYRTLMEAVRLARVPLTLACPPRSIAGLDLPRGVSVLSNLPHQDYRRLILSADLVVTPTVAPAYPSGQSVVLEAMSMGRATLTTDSTAIRDYITNEVDGVLVPPRQPEAIAELIVDLLTDTDRLEALGSAASDTVRKRFNLDLLWRRVADIMLSISNDKSRSNDILSPGCAQSEHNDTKRPGSGTSLLHETSVQRGQR